MKERIKNFFSNIIVKRILIGLCITITTLILEVFVFNYRAFVNRGTTYDVSGSEIIYRNVEKVEIEDPTKPVYVIGTDSYPTLTIRFKEDRQVNTIAAYINFENPDIYRYELSVESYYSTDGQRVKFTSYRNLEYINDLETSRYFEPAFNHASDTIVLTFVSIDHVESIIGQKFSVDKISFNYDIPFQFSFVRVFALNFVAGSVYLFALLFVDRRKEWIKKGKPKINVKKLVLDLIVYSIPIVGVILLYGFYGNFMHDFCSPDSGTQISKELVDAFMKGQVHLDLEVSEELLALQNPYEPSSRYGVSYYWDHLFYNGKYYSYYGITPVFLLFLPFRLIFKKYLYDAYGILLFTVVGLVFLALSYETMIKQMKKKKEIPLYLKYFMFILLSLGCGAIFQVVRPYFYEVSTSCAFMCAMISLFHIFKSGVVFENKQKKYFYYHLVFSSLWMALAVLARATFALYALAHVVILAYYFFKKHKEMDVKKIVLFFVFSLAPYVIFGSIQCVYNYLRFKSIFDFGIEYSLTIADFKNMPFHGGNVFTSLYHFFLNPGVPTEYAYFMGGNTLTFGAAFYYYETAATLGLVFRMPFILLIFLIPLVIKTNKKERFERLIYGWFPCVLIPIIVVAITWQSGYATRYYSDFSWPLLFFAVYMVFRLYDEKIKSDKRQLFTFVLLSSHVVFSLLMTFSMVLMYVPSLTHFYGVPYYEYTNLYYWIGRQLSFWR